jgi:FkbM family methyltransferase
MVRMVPAKILIKRCLESLGFCVFRLQKMPFGVDLVNDVKRLAGAEPIHVIFDVGANTGQSAVRFARSFPDSTIFSFEPEHQAYAQLQQNVRSLSCVRPYNIALGCRPGTVTMYRPQNSGLYTLRPPRGWAAGETAEVTVLTIDDLCATERVSQIDILKTDTEGYDLEVLRGARGLLADRKVRFIYAECEFVPSARDHHTNFFELYEFLVEYGYLLVGLSTENVVPSRGLDWGNALFVPANGRGTSLS